MRLLLDTHAFLWWMADDSRLPKHGRSLVAAPENTVLVSAASIWEIAIKASLQKIELAGPPTALVEEARRSGIVLLPVAPEHAATVYDLPHIHRDPFDRLLVAQCIVERATLLSADRALDEYGIEVVW